MTRAEAREIAVAEADAEFAVSGEVLNIDKMTEEILQAHVSLLKPWQGVCSCGHPLGYHDSGDCLAARCSCRATAK